MTDGPTKFLIGLVIIILFIALGTVFFSDVGLLSDNFLTQMPTWMIPFMTVVLIIFIVRLVIK